MSHVSRGFVSIRRPPVRPGLGNRGLGIRPAHPREAKRARLERHRTVTDTLQPYYASN